MQQLYLGAHILTIIPIWTLRPLNHIPNQFHPRPMHCQFYCVLSLHFFLVIESYRVPFFAFKSCCMFKNDYTTINATHFWLFYLVFIYIRNMKGAFHIGSVYFLNRKLSILELNPHFTVFYCNIFQTFSAQYPL